MFTALFVLGLAALCMHLSLADATLRHDWGEVHFLATVALAGGQIILLDDGRPAVVGGMRGPSIGDAVTAYTVGVFDVSSASATLFDRGEDVWWDLTNRLAVKAGAATASFRLGVATVAKISGDLTVATDFNVVKTSRQHEDLADAATLTNSAVETVLYTHVFKAGSLRIGDIIDFMAMVKALAVNGIDTQRFRVRLGGLAGTIVGDTGAFNPVPGDHGTIRGQLTIRSIGAAAVVEGAAIGFLKSNVLAVGGEATIDLTADQTLVVTAVHSAANVGNQTVGRAFNVRRV